MNYLTVAVQTTGETVTTALPAEGISSVAALTVGLPLLGAFLLLLGGRRTNAIGPALATGLSWGSFGVGVGMLAELLSVAPEERVRSVHLFDWLPAGSFHVQAGLQVDPLSVTFVMLVTFVGSLIHIYSLGYMAHDPDRRRFFAYLNLFVAAMLLLVLADNYLLLYVGWEGVGLASYLLIGFWNYNPDYAAAAKKAFVVNRVGDVGMGLAIMAMFATFGAVDFTRVLGKAEAAPTGWLTFIGLMLLLAACGKSAQFPLQSWLGDAMAGPTPVSALIHAATMVTAGVYLVVRSGPIFEGAPTAALAVAIVGAITLTYGAIVGCAKDDIKKALAASTMSQIGYMMLAAGLGPIGYAFAIFHLVTHGFFKAGMFLGAGSVMHGMNDRVDMRTFGHLSSKMKTTWLTFGAGWLAIIGFPLLSGFWSKDKIIEAAFVGEGWRPWTFGFITLAVAGLTAFYMSRLFFMTFQGKQRWLEEDHPHESPASMTIPMIVLAIGSVVLGGVLWFLGFTTWLEPVTGHHEHGEPVLTPILITILTLAVVALGVLLAANQYISKDVPRTAPAGSWLTQAARADLYQEHVNRGVFERPGRLITETLATADRELVDGGAVGSGRLMSYLGRGISRVQNGFVRSYAATMLVGVVAVLGLTLMWR